MCCSNAIAEGLPTRQAGRAMSDGPLDTAPTGDFSVRSLILVVLAAVQLVWIGPLLWVLSRSG